ncbi:unnamed protein product [Sphagnum jensenii]|uniref:Cyclic nucleotide-binding domain-containing protein n=1 Tax=Sphagnum jensenii TaxID=128206 RepID=A0ABP1ALD1_9BRYO
MIEFQVKERRRRTLSFRRTGVSAECQVADESYVPRVVLKPDAAKKRIEAALEKNALFKGLDKEQINTVIDAVEEEKHKAGDVIIKQGESGLYFYLLEAGACEVWLSMHNARNPQMVKTYGPGDSFGELALLYDAPRAATIKASTDCILWTMDRSTFRTILMASTRKKRNLYEDYLQNVPLLKTLDKYERSAIADVLEPEYFVAGKEIIIEGTPGDKFYFLEEGTAEARTRGAVVMKYGKGDYFGELALLNDEPRSATVLAVTDCKVVSINSESFKRLLGKLEDILQRKKTEYAAATASTS